MEDEKEEESYEVESSSGEEESVVASVDEAELEVCCWVTAGVGAGRFVSLEGQEHSGNLAPHSGHVHSQASG